MILTGDGKKANQYSSPFINRNAFLTGKKSKISV
jgi:hypothetical protein